MFNRFQKAPRSAFGLTAENLARQSRNQNSEYLAQRVKTLSIRPFGQAQGKLREKSFSDPSHSLGMTDFGPSLGVPFGFAQDMLGVLSTSLKTGLARVNPRFGSHGPPESFRKPRKLSRIVQRPHIIFKEILTHHKDHTVGRVWNRPSTFFQNRSLIVFTVCSNSPRSSASNLASFSPA